MNLPNELLDTVRDLKAGAARRSGDLRAALKEAEEEEKTWTSLLDYMNRDWPIHILHLINEKQAIFKRMRHESHPGVIHLEEVFRSAKDEAEQVRRRFPNRLDEACRAAKLEIDADSRHPKYYFQQKFFTLEVNDQKQQARLSDHEGKVAECPADIGAVVETVKKERDRIFGRKFESKIFLRKLRRQYLMAVKQEKQDDGFPIPIRHITRRLGRNEKGFRSDEFLADLSRLVEQGPLEIDGRRLDLQQTKDTGQGMLLYGAASRGYIGFIVFRKVE